MEGTERKERAKKYVMHVVSAWILALPFFYVGWRNDYKVLIFMPVCCMCLYNMESKKILKSFFALISVLLGATVLCALAGSVRNLTWPNGERFIAAFGTVNTTDFSAYVLFLLIVAWCCRKTHKWYIDLFHAFISVCLVFFVWLHTDSKTSLICCGLFLFFILWDSLEENVLSRNNSLKHLRKSIEWLCILSFPIIIILLSWLTKQFGQQDPIALKVDDLSSGRLSVTWQPYIDYGVHAFGNKITSAHGWGGTVFAAWGTGYGYIDVAYAMMAIRYGWIITGIITALWIMMIVKAFRSDNRRIAFVLVILAVHGFSEARILDINYNIFLAMPFCSFLSKQEKPLPEIRSIRERERSVFCFRVLSGIVITGIVIWMCPRILSMLRTFFSVLGWNAGVNANKSLLFCIAFILIVLLLWKGTILIWTCRSVKKVIPLTLSVLLIIGGIIAVNGTIEKERIERETILAEEKKAVDLVQEKASLPVYAAEPEEIFQRTFGGFSNHVFSTNELGSMPRGSIFTDQQVEALGITAWGGQYTQISERTGLYTFDEAVIDALAEAGYEWTPYYSGIRRINLEDVGLFNGLNLGKPLRGPIEIVTENSKLDQGGTIEVVFRLSSKYTNIEEAICILRVLADDGERVLMEKPLHPEDFDPNGQCICSMVYTIGITPKVTYSIYISEGVEMTIQEISWKQVA